MVVIEIQEYKDKEYVGSAYFSNIEDARVFANAKKGTGLNVEMFCYGSMEKFIENAFPNDGGMSDGQILDEIAKIDKFVIDK